MTINYVKTRHGNVSVADPILYTLRELLPAGRIRCVEIPEKIAGIGSRTSLEREINGGQPDIAIGYGKAAEHILRHSHRYRIVINPDIDAELLSMFEDRIGVIMLWTEDRNGAPTREFLITDLLPAIDRAKEAAQAYVKEIAELADLALQETDLSPKEFREDNDILDNLERYPFSVRISERRCPECGSKMLEFYVCSPPWTWANLCGRAGTITFCPRCKSQQGFALEFMN